MPPHLLFSGGLTFLLLGDCALNTITGERKHDDEQKENSAFLMASSFIDAPLKRIMVLVVFIEPGGFPSSSVAL